MIPFPVLYSRFSMSIIEIIYTRSTQKKLKKKTNNLHTYSFAFFSGTLLSVNSIINSNIQKIIYHPTNPNSNHVGPLKE